MKKKEAIEFFGSQRALAQALEVTSQAISQWTDPLSPSKSDRIRGAAIRCGYSYQACFLLGEKKPEISMKEKKRKSKTEMLNEMAGEGNVEYGMIFYKDPVSGECTKRPGWYWTVREKPPLYIGCNFKMAQEYFQLHRPKPW